MRPNLNQPFDTKESYYEEAATFLYLDIVRSYHTKEGESLLCQASAKNTAGLVDTLYYCMRRVGEKHPQYAFEQACAVAPMVGCIFEIEIKEEVAVAFSINPQGETEFGMVTIMNWAVCEGFKNGQPIVSTISNLRTGVQEIIVLPLRDWLQSLGTSNYTMRTLLLPKMREKYEKGNQTRNPR